MKLFASVLDDILLSIMVEERFLQLCQLHRQRHGTDLKIPADIMPDMKCWREMVNRHKCKKCGSRQLAIGDGGIPLIGKLDRLPCCGDCGGRGDYQHTRKEMKSLRAVAEWTVRMDAELRGLPEPEEPVINWKKKI